jgi:hypothetical protein
MRGALARVPAGCPDFLRGRARAKPFLIRFVGRSKNLEQKRLHLAATALLTSMFVPSTVPVTVAFWPAC